MVKFSKPRDFLEISPAAVDKIAGLIASRKRGPLAVRVLMQGRIPGGYQSEFKFVKPDERTADDVAQNVGPFMIYADAETAEILTGAKVDFDERKYQAGFNIEYPGQLGGAPPEANKEWDEPLPQAVQQTINEQINPALAAPE